MRAVAFLSAALYLAVVNAHVAPFHKAMYCLNGPQDQEDLNSYAIVSPAYQQPFSGWWMHGFNGCNKYPPAPGEFLDLPAGGSFMVEIASNRAKTFTAYGGRYASAWPDGNTYPEDYNVDSCIISPNLHTRNRAGVAGSAFAISYHSDMNAVTPENLVVFTVNHNSPWKRETHYQVPAAMPACPPGGCICAWGWVPNGCGQPNMYQTAFRCRVTGAKSTTPLASPKPPVWCEGNPGACVKGAKQMIIWNQNERNSVTVSGFDLSGQEKSPGYNMKMGFADGAQNDIFAGGPSAPPPAPAPAPPAPAPAPPAPAPAPPVTSPKPPAAPAVVPAAASPSSTSAAAAGKASASASSSAADSSSAASANSTVPSAKPPARARKCTTQSRKRAIEGLTARAPAHANIVVHKKHHARRGF